MEPIVAPAAEVAARWAYAELMSSRFADSYVNLVSADLRSKAQHKITFKSLSRDEQTQLQSALANHSDRGPGFYPCIMAYPIYTLEYWNRAQLDNVLVVPGLGYLPVHEFECDLPTQIRVALESIPSGHFGPDEAGIILPIPQGPANAFVLLDGTLRCLWFRRDGSHSQSFPVWVPTGKGLGAV